MRRLSALLATSIFPVLILIGLSACSNAAEETTTSAPTTTLAPTTTVRPTTTRPPTTTTTEPLPTSPINGVPVEDETLLDRRVIAVKIDNHPNARPQSGIELANAMIEVPVEGITRFIALFHSVDAEYLGPVRSGRPSDGRLLNPLDATMAISGGQSWIIAGLNGQVEGIIGEQRPAMFRISGRRAPHDLYTNTLLLREVADEREYSNSPPPTWFNFDEMPIGAEAASQVVMNFGNGFTVTWTWDAVAKRYQRVFGGTPAVYLDVAGETQPLMADTLVVILAERYTERAPAGQTSVPAMETTGTGDAYVFANGQIEAGTWSRESAEDLLVLTDVDGDEMAVPPGYLWVSIVPTQNGITFE